MTSEVELSRPPGSPESPISPSVLPSPVARQAGPPFTITPRLALVPTLPEITDLIKAVHQHGADNSFEAYMESMAMVERVAVIVEVINLHQEQSEMVTASLAYLWNTYVVPEKLWNYYEGGEDKFREDISYTDRIAPVLREARESENQKGRSITLLDIKWKPEWRERFNPGNPRREGERYLKLMANLARYGMTLPHAKQLIDYVKAMRISNPGRGVRKTPAFIAGDVQRVFDAVTAVSQSHKISRGDCAIEDLLSYLSRPRDRAVSLQVLPQIHLL